MTRPIPALIACCLSFAATFAQAGGAGQDAEEISKQLSNPVADLVSLPFQLNWENGVGPEDGLRFVLNFQPVVPFHLSPRWNLIGRMIAPYIAQPPLAPGVSATSGLGDILLSAFLSPAGGDSGLTWGVGPVLNLPATSDPALGSGKWGAGPTGLVLVSTPSWTYGALVNHVWGIADVSDAERSDLNGTFLQPFVARHFPKAVTLTVQSESTYDWEADNGEEWTVPVNVLVSRVTKLGPFPFSVAGGGGYYVESPAAGPDWKLRLAFTVILPGKK
jgi:hypothetical protein